MMPTYVRPQSEKGKKAFVKLLAKLNYKYADEIAKKAVPHREQEYPQEKQ